MCGRGSELDPCPLLDAKAKDDSERCPRLFGIDLGHAAKAIFKQDGNFSECGTGSLEKPQDLFLERIASAANVAEVDFFKSANLKAAERAAAIFGGKSEHPAGIKVHGLAHHAAFKWPIFDATSRHIA